jgi:myo-inositol-1-phosphate synthase
VEKIKIGIVGIGNCASALIQGVEYYGSRESNTMGITTRMKPLVLCTGILAATGLAISTS